MIRDAVRLELGRAGGREAQMLADAQRRLVAASGVDRAPARQLVEQLRRNSGLPIFVEEALKVLGKTQERQAAADAGAVAAVVAALRAHAASAGVQQWGCRALGNVCTGTDAAGVARKQAAADAGAVAAVVAALRAHAASAGVQEEWCYALANVCAGTDAAGLARRQAAADAGALDAVITARESSIEAVQRAAAAALMVLLP